MSLERKILKLLFLVWIDIREDEMTNKNLKKWLKIWAIFQITSFLLKICFWTLKIKKTTNVSLNPHLHEISDPPICTRVFQNTHKVRERTGKTNERTTVVDTNSLTSRGLLTQKKTIPGTKKVFGHLVVRNWLFKPHIFQNQFDTLNTGCTLIRTPQLGQKSFG